MDRIVLMILLVALSSLAQDRAVAQGCSPLELTPSPAMPGEPVAASTACSCFHQMSEPEILRSGTEVVIAYEANMICGIPPPPRTYEFDLGTFPPGQYLVIHAPVDEWTGLPMETQEALLIVQPFAIPVLGGHWTLVAFFAAFLAGAFYLRKRRTRGA